MENTPLAMISAKMIKISIVIDDILFWKESGVRRQEAGGRRQKAEGRRQEAGGRK
jgi:hypothetical protein